MNKKPFLFQRVLLSLTVLVVAACASQMEPAKQALDGIESAVSAASADAAKYVPDQLAAVQSKLTDLKASFDKKDYAAVVTGAPAVLAEAQSLATAAAAKKDEMMKAMSEEWTSMSASLPALVSAVQSRVAVLSKSRSVPKDVDLAGAKAGLADATSAWTQAQAAAAGGKVDEAVALATQVKDKAMAAAMALKMKLPGA